MRWVRLDVPVRQIIVKAAGRGPIATNGLAGIDVAKIIDAFTARLSDPGAALATIMVKVVPGQNGGNYIKFDETWDSFTNDFNSGGIYANGTSVPEKTSGSLDAGTVYSSYKKGVMCLQKKGDSVKRVLFLPSAPYGRFSPKKLSFFYQKYNSVYPATADMKLLLPKCYTMPEVRECYDAASSSYLARVIPGIKAEIAKSTNPECKKAFRWL
ncbi:hypothetical protein EC973_008470 [Apophysomyces ossiformis]|uniref:Uncharacterized protein n=1 Tax=Apophysomyces ossiformis TaxID=679940 RepID=A0A8H7BTT2_9FUNG|nr:hypothetical protein EC973_008470 [Apophysomyces ossiformis]